MALLGENGILPAMMQPDAGNDTVATNSVPSRN
jgi:hypothetical protein